MSGGDPLQGLVRGPPEGVLAHGDTRASNPRFEAAPGVATGGTAGDHVALPLA